MKFKYKGYTAETDSCYIYFKDENGDYGGEAVVEDEKIFEDLNIFTKIVKSWIDFFIERMIDTFKTYLKEDMQEYFESLDNGKKITCEFSTSREYILEKEEAIIEFNKKMKRKDAKWIMNICGTCYDKNVNYPMHVEIVEEKHESK